MAVYCLPFVICLLILSCGNGDAVLHSQDDYKVTGSLQRFKRYKRCDRSFSANGYIALKREKVEVEFLRDNSSYFARVKWEIPKVTKKPIDGFAVEWTSYINTDCVVVSNKTSRYDIRTSPQNWKYQDILRITIQPLPMKNGHYELVMLNFTPDYKGPTTYHQSSTSPMPSTEELPSTDKMVSTDKMASTDKMVSTDEMISHNMSSNGGAKHQDEYGVKLIIGSVIGVAVAIVLGIIFMHRFCRKGEAQQHCEDTCTIYISYYPESDKFVKDVKEFVYWLRGNGFDVQMLTDENDMLSVKNVKKRRELMQFKFRQHMLETVHTVFIILSPSYLKLCQIEKDDAKNENFSENEKLVNDEIVQIRWKLLENMYGREVSERFIPILFHINETAGIPFWMKELALYSWPEDKANNKLMNRLRDLPECPLNNNFA